MEHEIFQAVRSGETARVSELAEGFDLSEVDGNGRTVLYEAIIKGHTELARFLIERGANVNHMDKNCQTPLHFAAMYKRLDIARMILEHGGDLSLADKQGNQPLWTSLMCCAQVPDLIRLFLEHGADMRHRNRFAAAPCDLVLRDGPYGWLMSQAHRPGAAPEPRRRFEL